MKANHFFSLLLIFVSVNSFAQDSSKVLSSNYLIYPTKPIKHDDRMVMKIRDSISRIRVAQMNSSDRMPVAGGMEQKKLLDYPLGINSSNSAGGIYVLRANNKELALDETALNTIDFQKLAKKLEVEGTRKVIDKYNAKAAFVVFVTLKEDKLQHFMETAAQHLPFK